MPGVRVRASTLPEPWATLAAASGGVAGLADAMQVSEKTLHRWGAGTRPRSVAVRRRVEIVARRYGVSDPFA